ncbi:MAG: hypothetical protein WD967_01395 [Candidatus Levyibacteriota bacterium]
MKTERIVLAFIAALIGLLVAGILFFVYESTRNVSTAPDANSPTSAKKAEPSSSTFLTVSKPTDESVVGSKVVEVTGKTKPDATIIILTPLDQKVIAPTSSGNFATTVNIDSDQNVIEITAILKDGQQQKILRTVTFSTEKF